MLDVNGVITMPESISVPSSGLFEKKENTGSQMGQTNKKIFKKKKIVLNFLFNVNIILFCYFISTHEWNLKHQNYFHT
jgi:hypothetical protein